jgi:ferrochelatase
MPTYQSAPQYEHGLPESLGVLLVNLGTPDAPTPAAVRRYLKQFLSDPRVVEAPRLLWWLILHGYILRVRPARSARVYQKIWTEDGSPLLIHSQDIANSIAQQLTARISGAVHVELGMSYGEPSLDTALDRLYEKGAQRIVCLPLYPQYSGTTTASVFDAVTATLSRRRWVPEFRFISHYHDARGYIAARLIAESLELADDEWIVTFQSRVGRAEWLRPYTDETVTELGRKGLGRLDVVCPGFAADCLETLEEIAMQNAGFFTSAGGGSLNYIPALNARDDHVVFLTRLIEKHIGGWPESSTDWSASDVAREQDKSRQRAITMGASS